MCRGDADTVGLCLQQGGRDAVHGRTVRVSVYGRQQCDDFVFARLHRPQQGMGGVLAAAPVENRLYPFHVTCPALWKNPQTRVRYSGNLPSVPHFRSMPKSSAVVLPMSNPQASSDGRTSSGCRQGFPSGRVQVPSGQWRHVRRRRTKGRRTAVPSRAIAVRGVCVRAGSAVRLPTRGAPAFAERFS